MEEQKRLHEQALEKAHNYQKSESELLEILLQIEAKCVFRAMGYPSLHAYCTESLRLSDAHAYALVAVMRKSCEVPEMRALIGTGQMTLSNARRLVSVITSQNKQAWLEKGVSLSQRELEREIVKENPQALPKDRIRPLSDEWAELTTKARHSLIAKLKRAQDLLSQKTKRPVEIHEALETALDCLLEKHDPVRKAERNLCLAKIKSPVTTGRRHHPAQTQHAVNHRDQGQCAFIQPNGKRCQQRRWLQKHHVIAIHDGGENSAANLTTLCFHHHRYQHQIAPRRRVGHDRNSAIAKR